MGNINNRQNTESILNTLLTLTILADSSYGQAFYDSQMKKN